jgi:acyl carrier protein
VTQRSIDELVAELTAYVTSQTGDVVTPDTPLMESGILDSMGMVFFVAHVEEIYQLELSAEDLSRGVVSSIREAAGFVAAASAASDPSHELKCP